MPLLEWMYLLVFFAPILTLFVNLSKQEVNYFVVLIMLVNEKWLKIHRYYLSHLELDQNEKSLCHFQYRHPDIPYHLDFRYKQHQPRYYLQYSLRTSVSYFYSD